MIRDKDRSGYIGASDTGYVMRSWLTPTFDKWWRVKQGISSNCFTNDAMQAGTAYEHRVLDALGIPGMQKDNQIILGRLRVNLDGNTEEKIYEVKTHKSGKRFNVSLDYWRQVQVEMYAFGIFRAEIVAYALNEEDYVNFYREIDNERISHHEIQYDKDFIKAYLPRMRYLSYCLETGKWPNESEVKNDPIP